MDKRCTDLDLAARAAAGERDALVRLLETHYPRIHRLAWRLTGSRDRAEDVAQDVCIAVARRISGFRSEAAFGTWLAAIVVNAARDAHRREGRHAALARDWAEADGLRREGDSARAAERAWLHAALAALDEALRETAALVLEEGLSHAEAGRALGLREGTVSWRMSEIRRRLRARAQEERPET